jgi:endonuclease YncB( thermonuclease family)
LLVAACPAGATAAGRPVLDGLAQVLEDGSLLIQGRSVRLFGVYIPVDERTCRRYRRPARCSAEAVLVLDDRVTGFVRCEILRADARGGLEGICTVRDRDLFGPDIDLGASLVADGWALAGSDAPPQYVALERLARSREVGLWGDKFTNFR